MKNCSKIKQTCGTTNYASCIKYEGSTNNTSPLKEVCDISVEETTEDIYTQLEEINLSGLGENCLEYVVGEDNKIVVKNVLLKYEEEICTLKTKVAILENTMFLNSSILNGGLDFGTLVDSCDNPPQTLKDIIQILINQHIV